jgi:NitT/TauT family transport system substrate-binding protein
MKEAPDKFLILPLGELKASDEALFASTAFLEKNQAAVGVLVEELLKATRAINANPAFAVEERKRLGLLKDLPEKMEAEVLPYYQEGVQGGIFPADGGAARAAANDLEFFALAGQIKGEGAKAEDFWTLAPLKAALGRLGS